MGRLKANEDVLRNSPLYDNILRMRQETETEAFERRKKVCARCVYHSTSCDYLLMTGRIRPCAAADCVKAGVFRPVKTKHRAIAARPFLHIRWDREAE